MFLIYFIILCIGVIVVSIGLMYTLVKFNYLEGILFDYPIIMKEDENDYEVILRFYNLGQVIMHLVHGRTRIPRVGNSNGFCYLGMVEVKDQNKMKHELGSFPTLDRILLYCKENKIKVKEYQQHLLEVDDGLYHYDDAMNNAKRDEGANSYYRVGGFDVSSTVRKWYWSYDFFDLMCGIGIVILTFIIGALEDFFFDWHWYTIKFWITMIIGSELLVICKMGYVSYYTQMKIEELYGNDTDDFTEVNNMLIN